MNGLMNVGLVSAVLIVVFFVMALRSVKKSSNLKKTIDDTEEISKVDCPQCGTIHDFDDIKCPKCGLEQNKGYDVLFCRNCKNMYDTSYKRCPYCQTEGRIKGPEED